MKLLRSFLERGTVLLDAGASKVEQVPGAEFIRVLRCHMQGRPSLPCNVIASVEGGRDMEIGAGIEWRGEAGEKFGQVQFTNPLPVPLIVKYSYGTVNVRDDSLHVADAIAAEFRQRSPDRIECITPTSAPGCDGNKGVLLVPADERTAWVEVMVPDTSATIWVGDADVQQGRGVKLFPGDKRRFDTCAALYIIAEHDAVPSEGITGLRFFHQTEQVTNLEYIALASLLNLGVSESGGVEGYDQTFNFGFVTTTAHNLRVEREFYTVKDRIRITSNLGVLYDSGCVSGHAVNDVPIAVGTSWLRIEILADCESIGSTDWDFVTDVTS